MTLSSKITTVALAASLCAAAQAQNDECTTALTLVAGTPLAFDTGTATLSAEVWPCALNGGPDLWYSYTVPANTASFSVDTCGTSYDTALEVFDGTCGALNPLFCNDDACGFQSQIQVAGVTVGQTYFIRVGGYNNATGPGTITLTETGPPVQGCVLNPGFESGTLDGWTLLDNSGPFIPSMASLAGVDPGFGVIPATPTEGAWTFMTGFDGTGPETHSISQDVSVSTGLTPLTFDYRAGWDMVNLTQISTMDRTFSVVVRDMSGTVLQTDLLLTAAAATVTLDTGPLSASIDLSNYIGQTVNVAFEFFIPETFTGPGAIYVDNISCPSAPQGDIGTNYCVANPNTTGNIGTISATGSVVAANNSVTLTTNDLPNNQFGIFVVGDASAFVPNAGGTSNGNICVGGLVGRYSQPGQILSTGTAGSFSLQINLQTIPQGNGNVATMPGDTWYFQAWHRDGVGFGSNFTNGLEITFN